jgi:hypothetical protein
MSSPHDIYRQIFGLKANLKNLRLVLDRSTEPRMYHKMDNMLESEIYEAIERREVMLRVLEVRAAGKKPGKFRMIKIKQVCPACINGRTTLFSVGRCLCGEPNCPGRGVCHTCRGTMRVWGRTKRVTRPWPDIQRAITEVEESSCNS